MTELKVIRLPRYTKKLLKLYNFSNVICNQICIIHESNTKHIHMLIFIIYGVFKNTLL